MFRAVSASQRGQLLASTAKIAGQSAGRCATSVSRSRSASRLPRADGSPDAVDISEVELARRIVAEEQERFARDTMARQVGPPTAGTPQ
jgi:hypothetical protein